MKIKVILISVLLAFNLCSCQDKEAKNKKGIDITESELPAIGKEWTNADLQKAFDVLLGLKKLDTFSLPRMEDEETSVIFKKLMNSLPSVDPKDTLNMIEQFDNFGLFKSTLPNLFGLYGGNTEIENKFYSNEITEVLKRVIIETTNTSELYFSHYVPDLENSEENKNKIKSFNEGSFKIFLGVLNMNGTNYKYQSEDKLELAETISYNLKKIEPNLNEEYSSQLMEKVEYFSKEIEHPKIREVFSKLAKDISERK
jgi:hypothetical protein